MSEADSSAPPPPHLHAVPSHLSDDELPPEVLALKRELEEAISTASAAQDVIVETMRERTSTAPERAALLDQLERERASEATAESRAKYLRWVDMTKAMMRSFGRRRRRSR